MKHTSSILLTAALSLCAIADTYATPKVGDETFIGKVSLSKPSIVGEIRQANLSLTGTIQEQATVEKIVNVAPPNTTEGYLGSLAKAAKVSNSTILKELVDLDLITTTKGYSLRVSLFYGKDPLIQAVKKGQPTVTVPDSLLNLYFGWAEALDGVFSTGKGSASATVSTTASGTSVYLKSGKVTGFNAVDGELFNSIVFQGVGSFSETTKGYSGSANVAGGTSAL
jgi:hypothetical protein